MLKDNYRYYSNLVSDLPHGLLRRITKSKCRAYPTIEPLISKKRGIEIGGPSPMFQPGKLIPVYDRCLAIDNCNYSSETIWTSGADDQRFGPHRGKQFVAEACDLSPVPNEDYEFLLASHVLEHVANPLRALQEWVRVVVTGGLLLVLVPDKRNTFDHRRPDTLFPHIVGDFKKNTREDDLQHLEEVVTLHDLSLDPGAGTREQFRDRCLQNASVRAMHQHVFCPEVLVQMCSYLGIRVLDISIERPYHMILCAEKITPSENRQVESENQSFLEENADWRRLDPLSGRSRSVETKH